MRFIAILLLAFALATPAFAVDRWHRDQWGGQDLTDDDGTVVGMVRHADPTHKKPGWMGLVGKTRGSEEWEIIGNYKLMREAKQAVQAKTNVESDQSFSFGEGAAGED